MEDNESKVTEYLIPANVTTRFEFFSGFGWYELKIVAAVCLIGVAIFVALGLPKKTEKVSTPVEMSLSDLQSQTPTSEGVKITEKKTPIVPMMIRILFIVIPGGTAYFVVKRDVSTGLSLISTIKNAKEFRGKQKLYLYKYKSGSEVK